MKTVFDPSRVHSTTTLCYFMFYGALYVQGAAFHSASTMFKTSVKSIAELHDDAVVTDVSYWMRTVWEHIVSHYIYGGALAVLFAFQQWAYKDAEYSVLESIAASPVPAASSDDGAGRLNRVKDRETVVETHNDTRFNMKLLINGLICSSALVHGLAIAGSAIDFPSGIFVGLIYVVGGLVVTVYYLFITAPDRRLTTGERMTQALLDVSVNMHRRPIMMYFLWGFIVALVTMLVWVGIYGPVSRSDAGMLE